MVGIRVTVGGDGAAGDGRAVGDVREVDVVHALVVGDEKGLFLVQVQEMAAKRIMTLS